MVQTALDLPPVQPELFPVLAEMEQLKSGEDGREQPPERSVTGTRGPLQRLGDYLILRAAADTLKPL